MSKRPKHKLTNYFSFLKEGVDEAARTLEDAKQKNLAVFYDNHAWSSTRILLVDYKACLRFIESFGELQEIFDTVLDDIKKAKQQFWLRYSIILAEWLGIPYVEYLKMGPDRVVEIIDRLKGYLGHIKRGSYQDFMDFLAEQPEDTKHLIATWSIDELEEIQDELLEVARRLAPEQREILEALGEINPTNQMLLSAALERSIIGIITFSKPSSGECSEPNVYNIGVAAAQKGWGPLMYDMAMSLIHPDWLIADRGGASTAAQNVWSYYLNKRPDIEKEMMIQSLKSGSCFIPKIGLTADLKELEGNIYAYKFRIRNPRLDWNALEANAKTLSSELLNRFNMKASIETIGKAGMLFFDSKYVGSH